MRLVATHSFSDAAFSAAFRFATGADGLQNRISCV